MKECRVVWRVVEGCISNPLFVLGFAGVFDLTRELDKDLIRKT